MALVKVERSANFGDGMETRHGADQPPPRIASGGKRLRWWRLVAVLAVALATGFALRAVGDRLEQRRTAAGFAQGFLQGASMPLAFPTLVLGVDVTIYATHNDGVPYKLGYILGITACGACFFGAVYGRVAHWRASP
jgi:hypothetical protein